MMVDKASQWWARSLAGLLLTAWPLFSAAADKTDSKMLFDTQLLDLDGQPLSLDKYRGKPLIVNFWARLCIPCRTELPELNALNEKYRAEGLTIVGVAVEDQRESIRDFVEAYQLDYPIAVGRDASISLMQAMGNEIAGLPFTVVVDRDGNIVQQKMGVMTPEDIRIALDTILR